MRLTFFMKLTLCALFSLTAVEHSSSEPLHDYNNAPSYVKERIAKVAPDFVQELDNPDSSLLPMFIFVPGILGSKLERHNGKSSEVIWGELSRGLPNLAILEDDDENVKPTILFDFKTTIKDIDVYFGGISRIRKQYLGEKILFSFPYDWRQDNSITAAKLNDWLCDLYLPNRMGTRDVRFIAHSMGGLVVKEWFRKFGGKPQCKTDESEVRQEQKMNVKEIWFLGTPHLGSPKTITALVDGYSLLFNDMKGFVKTVLRKGEDYFLTNALNKYGASFPSFYQLLPIYHETSHCMAAYSRHDVSAWPPPILTMDNGKKFELFNWRYWKEFGWPRTIDDENTRDIFYQNALPAHLSRAKNFLCNLADYSFPKDVGISYYYGIGAPTHISFRIVRESSWIPGSRDSWSIEPAYETAETSVWRKADGTVPSFIAWHSLAAKVSSIQSDNFKPNICSEDHMKLLSCESFMRDVSVVVDRAANLIIKKAYNNIKENEDLRENVLREFAQNNVYFSNGLGHRDRSLSEVPLAVSLNQEIQKRSGKSIEQLLAAADNVRSPKQRARAYKIVAALDSANINRSAIEEKIALAQFQSGEVKEGIITLRNIHPEIRENQEITQLAAYEHADGDVIEVNNRLIVKMPTSQSIYSINFDRGAEIEWQYEPKLDPDVNPVRCCDRNTGITQGDGKLFVNQVDTTLVALDSNTGKVIWKVINGDPAKGETGAGAPVLAKDNVIVRTSGGEFGGQCHVTAYGIKDGKRNWRAFSIGPDDKLKFDPQMTIALGEPVGKDSGLQSWEGDQWKIGTSCEGESIIYDSDLDLIYHRSSTLATWNPNQRPGENKWAGSIFARDPDTGVAKWVYPMASQDELGIDGNYKMILSDAKLKGENRKALVIYDPNGLDHMLDRKNGSPLTPN